MSRREDPFSGKAGLHVFYNAAGPGAPGEWQQMRVTCPGPTIVVEVNGQKVRGMRA